MRTAGRQSRLIAVSLSVVLAAAFLPHPLVLAAVESRATSAVQPGALEQAEASGIDVAAVIETVRHHVGPSDGAPGAIEAQDPLYRAIFDPDGFSLSLRQSAPPEPPDPNTTPRAEAIPFEDTPALHLATQEIRRGAAPIPLSPGDWRGDYNAALREIAPGITERVTAREGHIEWDFVLERPLPGDGDLYILAGARAPSAPDIAGDRGSALSWPVGGGRSVRMGELVVRDARGAEIYRALPRADAARVTLSVPAIVLAEAAYPLTIDPTISAEYPLSDPRFADPGSARQHRPKVGWGGSSYLVVWADGRNSSFYDIYGARVSTDGVVLDPTGIAISTAPRDQDMAAIAWDGTNYLVVWEDDRNEVYTDTNADIYGARVRAVDGTLLDGPPDTGGIAITAAAYQQHNPAVAWNGTDYLVVWESETGAGVGDPVHIYGTRIAADGTVLDSPSIAISTGTANKGSPAVTCCSLLTGRPEFFVVWADDRNWTSTGRDIYGARVTDFGSLRDGLPGTGGIPISTASSHQEDPSVVWNGTNYLVVWEDWRDSGVSGPGIYGARVIGSSVLDAAGIAISTAWGQQSRPEVASDGVYSLVVWDDWRNLAATGSDIYGARIRISDGALMDGPPDTGGIAISTAVDAQAAPALAWDGANYLVAWEDIRHGGNVLTGAGWDIHGTRLRASDGALLDGAPATGGIAISTRSNNQRTPALAWDGTNYLAVWQDFHIGSGSADIYGARIAPDGTPLDGTGIAISTAADTQGRPAAAWDGANYLVIWEDYRNRATSGADIYGARVRATDGALLDGPPDTGGLAIATAGGDQTDPALAWDGANYLAVWQNTQVVVFNVYIDILGARLAPGGTVLGPVTISLGPLDSWQRRPAVAWDGTNYLVVWEDDRNAGSTDIYGTRVSTSGALLDGSAYTGGIAISTAADNQDRPALAWDGANYLVVWGDHRDRAATNSDIYGARVSAAGVVLDPAGIAVSTAVGDQRGPAVSWNGANYLAAWYDRRSGVNFDVYGTRVTAGGVVQDAAGLPIAATPELTNVDSIGRRPSATSGVFGTSIVAYVRPTPELGRSDRAYVRFITEPLLLGIRDARIVESDSGSVDAVIDVVLSTPSAQTVSVSYATGGGTATAGVDYRSTVGTLTLLPGDTAGTISVPVYGDLTDEPDETFLVLLFAPSNATIGDGEATVTIEDNDAPPVVTIGDAAVVEGAGGTISADFTVSLSDASAFDVSIDYATADGTAWAGSDYAASTGTLVIPAGATAGSISILINGDMVPEPDETFAVDLANPVNATFGDAQAIGTILNDDGAPPALAIDSVSAAEGNGGAADLIFTVTLTPPAAQDVTVDYATSDGTAAAGDYVATFGKLTIPAGAAAGTITVPVNGDLVYEADETFFVTLSGAANAAIAVGQGTGTITNDDPVPALSISDVSQPEGDSGMAGALFYLSLSNPSSAEIQVNYATADGTATALADYTAGAGLLTIPAGATGGVVSVPVVGDTYIEPDEFFLVNLSSPVNATIADGVAVGTILNDDRRDAFDPSIALAVGTGPVDVVAIDLDGDGDRDLAVANEGSYDLSILMNNGDGSFAAPVNYSPSMPGWCEALVAADLDADGDLDLAVAVMGGIDGVAILLNNGDGTFVGGGSVILGVGNNEPKSLAVADLDGDADLDLAVANRLSGSIIILRNRGDATYTAPVGYATGGGAVSVAAADLDGDADADLALANSWGNAAVVLRNNGDATFAAAESYDVGGSANGILVEDLDADGDKDLAVANGGAGAVSILLNNGDGTMAVAVNYGAGTTPLDVAAADWDQDGDLDLVAANKASDDVSVLLNDGGGTFAAAAGYAAGDGPTAVAAGDLDGDGDPDAVVANFNSNDLSLLFNRIPATVSVGFSTAGGPVSEGAGPAVINVQVLTSDGGALPGDVIVDYTTGDGTAAAGADYVAVTGAVSFTAGAPSGSVQMVSVPLLDDALDEDDETFTLTLSNPGGAALGTATHTVTITDNDPPPELAIGDVVLAEGDSGTIGAVFTVTLSPVSGRDVTVDYLTVGSSASAGSDFLATPGTLTIPAGAASADLTVTVNGDWQIEADETFLVFLSNQVNATLADSLGVGTILNDDFDTDADGLTDGWETLFFGNLGTANAATDFDNNGYLDVTEFLAGTDPTLYSSAPGPITLYVDDDNTSGIEDGSPAFPFNTIQEAEAVSRAGDTIRVLAGSYVGPVTISRDNLIVLGSGTATTMVDANGLGRALTIDGRSNVQFEGFTLTGGQADFGAGIHVGYSSNVTIRGVAVVESGAAASGGGIAITGDSSTVHIRNAVVADNGATVSGGGIYIDTTGTDIRIINATVANNTSPQSGIHVANGAPAIRNAILWNNAGQDLYGVTDTMIGYSLIGDGTHAGLNGNIAGGPLFVDPPTGDYHVKPCSPAVDAGDPLDDVGQEPAPNGGRINAGAYGGTNEAALTPDPTDGDGDGRPDACDNCTLVSNTDQRDTNADGYGNACDADLNNDLLVNTLDFGLFRQAFGSTGPALDADFNADGIVNTLDFGRFRQMFGAPPGPSGIAP